MSTRAFACPHASMQHPLLAPLLGFGLALLAAEAYVRPVYTLRTRYEPGLGYVNAPGRLRWGLEGHATSTWLAHGVRLTPHAPAAGKHVLVLGDSFTEAVMIPDDSTFVAVAQRALVDRHVDATLVNAGRSTMSAADYVALAPTYRRLFPETSWVVVELRGDDLREDAWTETRPHFVAHGETLDADARVEPERTGLSRRFFELRQHSMALAYAVVRIGKFRTVPEPPLFHAGAASPPPRPALDAPVEAELARLVAAWDGHVTFLYVSDTLEGVRDDDTEARVRAFCHARGASCAFTSEANRALRARGEAPAGFSNTAWGAGHLNEAGHAIAGAVLADALAEALR